MSIDAHRAGVADEIGAGRRPRRIWPAALALASLVAASPCAALQFTPFVQDFAPQGREARRTYSLENDGDAPIAVQVRMVERRMALDGSEQNLDAEDDFVVFPPQLVLQPGERRTVRVQWIGDPAPTVELAYRIIVEQLPVDFGGPARTGLNVQLLVRYEGAVYIAPPGVAGAAALEAVEPVEGGGGAKRLAVTVVNRGTAHTVLRSPRLALKSQRDSSAATLPAERLDGLRGENVLAGGRRRFVLPWPDGLTFGPVTAEMSFTAGN